MEKSEGKENHMVGGDTVVGGNHRWRYGVKCASLIDGIKETERVCALQLREKRRGRTTGADERMPDQGQTAEEVRSTKVQNRWG